jgi:hypothetical protein
MQATAEALLQAASRPVTITSLPIIQRMSTAPPADYLGQACAQATLLRHVVEFYSTPGVDLNIPRFLKDFVSQEHQAAYTSLPAWQAAIRVTGSPTLDHVLDRTTLNVRQMDAFATRTCNDLGRAMWSLQLRGWYVDQPPATQQQKVQQYLEPFQAVIALATYATWRRMVAPSAGPTWALPPDPEWLPLSHSFPTSIPSSEGRFYRPWADGATSIAS